MFLLQKTKSQHITILLWQITLFFVKTLLLNISENCACTSVSCLDVAPNCCSL